MTIHNIGDILYVNGCNRTEKLTIKKVGRLYATFEEAPHRLILEKETIGVGLVELKRTTNGISILSHLIQPLKLKNG